MKIISENWNDFLTLKSFYSGLKQTLAERHGVYWFLSNRDSDDNRIKFNRLFHLSIHEKDFITGQVCLFCKQLHFGMEFTWGGYKKLTIFAGLPFLGQIYISPTGLVPKVIANRMSHIGSNFGICFLEDTLAWDFAYSYEGSNRHWWRHKSIHIPDFVLGRQVVSDRVVYRQSGLLVLEDNEIYISDFDITLYEWKRSRSPFKGKFFRANVSVEGGIPVPGKGENSHDQGEDRSYDYSVPVPKGYSTTQAMELVAQSMMDYVMERRKKYGPRSS